LAAPLRSLVAGPFARAVGRPVGRRALALGLLLALGALLLVPAVALGATGPDAAHDGGSTTAALLAIAVGVTIAALAVGPAAHRHDARTGRHR
jgi:hypothetical protein